MSEKDQNFLVKDVDNDSDIELIDRRFEYRGRVQTLGEWGKEIGLSEKSMIKRYERYGAVYFLLFEKKEFIEAVNNLSGNEAYRSLDNRVPNPPYFVRSDRDLKDSDIDYSAAVGLVTLMIEDAKHNMVTMSTDSKYFKESRDFLMNIGGGLERTLEIVGVDSKRAIKELRQYANVGFVYQRRERMGRRRTDYE